MWIFTPAYNYSFKLFVTICALFDLYFSEVSQVGATDVNTHLEMGTKLLAAGQLAEALSHYNAAVEGDPNNPLTYFRRATVYMALGKSRSALPDFDHSIKLNGNFLPAYIARGNIFLKRGDITAAKDDYRRALELNEGNADALHGLDQLNPLADYIENAKNLYENNMYTDAVQYLDKAIEIAPFNKELREMRAVCFEKMGEYQKAVSDMRSLTKLINDNTEGFLKLSLLLYRLGEADMSLSEIRECLKLDPDHKDCFAHYKKVKKLAQQLGRTQEHMNSKQWEECVTRAQAVLRTESTVPAIAARVSELLCHCRSKGALPEAVSSCTEALTHNPGNPDHLCDRAEAYIHESQFQDAIRDYQSVLEHERRNQRAREGMDRAQKMLKNQNKRDYYKILGVSRNASKRDILRAFRKLAAKYHPDHYQGEDKKRAQKQYLDIGDAKDVLTDPEKRAKFDQGDDPMDPEQQTRSPHQGGGFTFHGFNPFESDGSGGNFEFFFG